MLALPCSLPAYPTSRDHSACPASLTFDMAAATAVAEAPYLVTAKEQAWVNWGRVPAVLARVVAAAITSGEELAISWAAWSMLPAATAAATGR